MHPPERIRRSRTLLNRVVSGCLHVVMACDVDI
jgi:hypothetical protein